MIRTAREKGSRGRLASLLAGLLLAATAAGGPAPTAGAAGSNWWEVRLSVAAKGTFMLRGGGEAPLSGEYSLRARFEGRLNPDGDDFLLVHLRTETLEWSLREKAGPGDAASAGESPKSPAPVLRLNYVLREKGRIELDFAFDGGAVPLRAALLGVSLELPCSAHGVAEGRPGYVDDVLVGSNRIALPASDLVRRRPERTFAWTWTGTKRTEAGSRAYITVQSHSVEAVVGLVRH
jgi:hypothetical protein